MVSTCPDVGAATAEPPPLTVNATVNAPAPTAANALLLNLLIAVSGIVLLGAALTTERLSALEAAVVTAGVILFAPLVPMVWIGMEHTLHIALTIAAAWLCRRCVRDAAGRREVAWLVAVSAAMTLTRYEGLFVVAGCALALLALALYVPAPYRPASR